MEINFGNFTIGKIKNKKKKNNKKKFFKSRVFSKKSFQETKKIQISKLKTLDRYLSEDKHERTINDAGEVKSNGAFAYLDGGDVPVGTPYHIHYSSIGKTEIYMTGKKHNEVSQVITRLKGNTNFGKYVNLISPSSGMAYLPSVPFKFEVTKKNRKLQMSYRYFAKLVNSDVTPEFEISKSDHGKNTPLYQKAKVKWSLDLSKDMMINKNIDEIDRIVGEGFKSLEYSLNPAEGHIEGDMSLQEEKVEKLKKLLPKQKFISPKKKRRKKKKNLFKKGKFTTSSDEIISKSTDTSSNPPPGWSAGDGPPPGSGY